MAQVASAFSHDLNQPLTAIGVYAEGCQEMLDRGACDPAELKEAVDQIALLTFRAGQALQVLRQQFRPLGKKQRVDLGFLIRQVEESIAPLASEHGVSILCTPPDDPVPVQADPDALRALLGELLQNAIDAMVEMGEAPRDLRVSVSSQGEFARTAIGDTGPGFPPGPMEEWFRPFKSTRADRLGMGLTICRSIAESHLGRLTVEKQPGGGAILVLDLPADGRGG